MLRSQNTDVLGGPNPNLPSEPFLLLPSAGPPLNVIFKNLLGLGRHCTVDRGKRTGGHQIFVDMPTRAQGSAEMPN